MKIFAYSIVYDTGFAPCAVQGGSLSLACCKTFLRHKIGLLLSQNPTEEIYLIGFCGKQLAKRHFTLDYTCRSYSPIFIAKINSAVTTQEYFKNDITKRRPDQKYSYNNGKWSVLRGNPHYPDGERELTDDEAKKEKDLYYYFRKNSNPAENYVLISDEYVYYGKKLRPRNELNEYIERIARIREGAPRSDLSPIEPDENDKNHFLVFFNAELEKGINEKCETLDDYFERKYRKGECKKR